MGLKVFNLQCDSGHLFEGWFGSHEDYDDQSRRGLIECPVCQSKAVERMPSAPRIAKSRDSSSHGMSHGASETAAMMAGASEELARLQAQILKQFREFVQSTEDVGTQFASEARRIHEGEAEARPIRGIATAEERQELQEEGISVVVLPEFLLDDRLN